MKMKMNSLKAVAAIGLSALAIGSAAAQDAASKPVGYETLDYGAGFTPLGIRLHQAPVTSGVIASADANSITVTGADFDALLTAGTSYLLEVENAAGVIEMISSWSGETLTVASDLTSQIDVGVTTFTIRPVANLNTVFGGTSTAVSLAQGGGNDVGADVVYVPDGQGGYDRYYYDTFAPPTFNVQSWTRLDASLQFGGEAVDGSSIDLVYADGVIVSSSNGGSTVITGSVKTGPTMLTLIQNGFSFVSSIAPAGQNLVTAFGSTSDEVLLAEGGGNDVGADQIWVQQDDGSYITYYFDAFAPPTFDVESWVQLDSTAQFGGFAIDGSTVSLPSGYAINSSTGGNRTQGVPPFYSSL